MRIRIFMAIATLLMATSLLAQAAAEKHWQVGLGLYRSAISYNNTSDDEFSGVAISASYAATDNVAFRGTIFSLEHDDFSEIDSSGYDLVIYGGTGLLTQGFKIYGGGGIFKDTWEVLGLEESFNGFQLNGGLGYNWDVVAIDLVIGIRGTSDYDDLANQFGSTVDAAVSSNLSLSVRF
jgi:hypothetical protein